MRTYMERPIIMGEATPEEIIRRAIDISGENMELRQTIEELRGRLRESRRSASYYRKEYQAAMKYRHEVETGRQRDKARVRELMVAVAGVAVLGTCLLFVGAVCWGWWFG